MSSAALRAAPMARITVAAPVTMSPPAHTPRKLVRPDSREGADVAARRALEAGGALEQHRVGARAHGHHDHVHVDQEVRARTGYGPAAARLVGLAHLHAHALHRAHPALVVAAVSHGAREVLEAHALLLGVLDLLLARRHLGARAPVDDGDLARAHAQRRARAVHGHVAAAHHGHARALRRRRVVLGEQERLHEVDAGEVLVGGHDVAEVLAGQAHEAGQARARGQVHGVVAAREELVERVELAHDAVELELRRPCGADCRSPPPRWPWAGGTPGCRTPARRRVCAATRRW